MVKRREEAGKLEKKSNKEGAEREEKSDKEEEKSERWQMTEWCIGR